MILNTSDDDDDDDDDDGKNSLITSSSSHQRSHNFMCSFQNPSFHSEEVSGIMKQMWVE